MFVYKNYVHLSTYIGMLNMLFHSNGEEETLFGPINLGKNKKNERGGVLI